MKNNDPILRFQNSVFFYPLLSFAALFPCLALGLVYFDGDILLYSSIARDFLKTSFAEGRLPLWNPYVFAGQPFWADPSSLVCYPLLYPTLLFPTPYGLGVFQFLHVCVAAFGMRFWLKEMYLSEEASWAGAVSFAFSGFYWNEISHPMCQAAFAWIPWLLGSLEAFSNQFNRRTAFQSGLAFTLIFLTGSFQIILGTLYFAFFYLIVLKRKKLWERAAARPKESFILFLFLIWGSLPFLFLWIPASEFMSFSDRFLPDLSYENFNAGISIKPQNLHQFLFPVHPIDPTKGITLAFEDFAANAGFMGIWAPFLALLAFRGKNQKGRLFLGIASILTLSLCFGKYFFVHRWFTEWVPGFHLLRGPFRFLYLYAACFSVLIAFGYEKLLQRGNRTKKDLVFSWTCSLVMVASAWFFHGSSPSLVQVLLFILGSIGLLGLINLGRFSHWGKWLFPASLVLSLLAGGWTLCPSRLGPASNLDFKKETPLLLAVQEKIGPSRVFLGNNIPHSVESNGQFSLVEFPGNASCLFKLRGVGGYNTLSLARRGDLHTIPFPSFLRLMGVHGFLTGNEKGEVPGFTRDLWGPLRFYLAKAETPMVYAPGQMEVVRNGRDLLEKIRGTGFNPYEKSYLEEEFPKGTEPGNLTGKNHFGSKLLSEDLNAQLYELRLDSSRWVIFSEVNYPGWKVWVDGIQKPILTSNYLFRAVFIPSGTHQVRFHFEPGWQTLLFSALGIWMVITMGFWGWKRIL